jgi:hypothetical protein
MQWELEIGRAVIQERFSLQKAPKRRGIVADAHAVEVAAVIAGSRMEFLVL